MVTLFALKELASREGIELRENPDDLDYSLPYHCDKQMQVRTGICGPDYGRCDECGLDIRMIGSPHVNGGLVMGDEWWDEQGERLWLRTDNLATPASSPPPEGSST